MAQGKSRRDIETKMRRYAAACARLPAQLEETGKKEERIKTLLKIAPPPRTRGKRWNFVLEQIGYLGRYCLVWQGLWAVLFGYLMRHGIPYLGGGERENEILVLVSLLPLLLALLAVEAVTKVYQRSMLEIEYTTKYSLQSVVMVRMLALSVFHAALLAAVICCVHKVADSDIRTLFVYGFTPLILVTGILARLMQCCQGEQLRSAAVGVYVFTAALVLLGDTKYFDWYRPDFLGTWCVVCAAGTVFAVWQFDRMRRRLACFEQAVSRN